jgi:CBS domain-containing protein
LLIALAGPAVSVGIAVFLLAALQLQGTAPQLDEYARGSAPFAERLMFINAGLAAFNLLPAFPMDGGRVLRALLALRLDYARATELAAHTGQAIALLFAVLGAMTNPLLVIIALFVWFGAAGEAGLARLKQAFRGTTVDAAMRTEFGALAPDDARGRATEMAIRHAQADLPVVLDGRVVGLLTRGDMLRWLAENGANRTAGDLMHRGVDTVDRSEPLEAAFARLEQQSDRTLLVTDHGRLVGLVGPSEIAQLLRMRRASARRSRQA